MMILPIVEEYHTTGNTSEEGIERLFSNFRKVTETGFHYPEINKWRFDGDYEPVVIETSTRANLLRANQSVMTNILTSKK